MAAWKLNPQMRLRRKGNTPPRARASDRRRQIDNPPLSNHRRFCQKITRSAAPGVKMPRHRRRRLNTFGTMRSPKKWEAPSTRLGRVSLSMTDERSLSSETRIFLRLFCLIACIYRLPEKRREGRVDSTYSERILTDENQNRRNCLTRLLSTHHHLVAHHERLSGRTRSGGRQILTHEAGGRKGRHRTPLERFKTDVK